MNGCYSYVNTLSSYVSSIMVPMLPFINYYDIYRYCALFQWQTKLETVSCEQKRFDLLINRKSKIEK